MKLIGLSSSTTENRTFVNTAYMGALTRPGIVPVGLPLFPILSREVGTIADYQAAHQDHISGLVERLDALVLTGGVDINPVTFDDPIWGAMSVNGERDFMEASLIAAFVAAGKPILGICRGLQIIGHYLNLPNFLQDLSPTDEVHQAADRDIKDRAEPIHIAYVLGEYQAYLREKTGRHDLVSINVNSHHHQGYCLTRSGKAPDKMKRAERSQWLGNTLATYQADNDIKVLSCTGMVIEGFEKAEIKMVAHQHHPEEYGAKGLAIDYWLSRYVLNA